MGWVSAGSLALWISLPAAAGQARGVIQVTAQVVRSARIELGIAPSLEPGAPRTVRGGTEWRVPFGASVRTSMSAAEDARAAGIAFLVKGCEGARANWSGSAEDGAARALRVFVPQGAECAPVVVATVFPDGAPPETEVIRN